MLPNKTLKVGDLILFIKANNGQQNFENKILRIRNKNSNYGCIDEETGATTSVYWTNPCDVYIECNRKNIYKYKKKKLNLLQKDIKKLERDVKELEEYPTEEAFEAHCIKKILENGNNEEAIIKILKLMSNLKNIYY